MENRSQRIEEALRECAAEFIVREAGPQSLITVTRVILSPDGGRASIHLSVLPTDKEQAALGLMNRNIEELKDFIRSRVKIGRLPHLEFLIDEGEKNRQRLDEIS